MRRLSGEPPRRKAEAVGAGPILVGNQDFSAHEERGRLVYQDEDGLLDLPRPRLAGPGQAVRLRLPKRVHSSSTMTAPITEPTIPDGWRKPSWESLWKRR